MPMRRNDLHDRRRRPEEDRRGERDRDGAERRPDDAARASFKKLADRLRDFDEGGTISTGAFVPTGYRGILIERGVDVPACPAHPRRVAPGT
jgi:hypothetical protein